MPPPHKRNTPCHVPDHSRDNLTQSVYKSRLTPHAAAPCEHRDSPRRHVRAGLGVGVVRARVRRPGAPRPPAGSMRKWFPPHEIVEDSDTPILAATRQWLTRYFEGASAE